MFHAAKLSGMILSSILFINLLFNKVHGQLEYNGRSNTLQLEKASKSTQQNTHYLASFSLSQH